MQTTTIHVFRFKGIANQFWALQQMGIGSWKLGRPKGLQFFKFLGSGSGNGFSIRPSFSTWCLLAVWDNIEQAEAFVCENRLFAEYTRRSYNPTTYFMHNTMSHGFWDQRQPFEKVTDFRAEAPVAVITRATIRRRLLWHFWKYVPSVSQSMEGAPGLQMAIGIGELPLVQQATFSVWDSGKAMMDYAYKAPHHSEVVRKTRELNWYKEELFARFVVVRVV